MSGQIQRSVGFGQAVTVTDSGNMPVCTFPLARGIAAEVGGLIGAAVEPQSGGKSANVHACTFLDAATIRIE